MSSWQAVATTDQLHHPDLDSAAPLKGIRFPGPGLKHNPALAAILRPLAQQALSAWRWLHAKRTQQLTNRRLRVAETVSLGEKRFVSILQVDGTHFLVGGAAGSVSLLAILDKQQSTCPTVTIATEQK